MGTELVVSDGVGKFDILWTRLLLMFGGPFGFHLLYLREPLEAYVYFATFGLFLIAVFYDAITLNSRVAARNEEIDIRFISDRKVKVVSTSIIRFIAQFLFGCWIGFLFCLVTVLLFGTGHRVLLALFIASGVTQGVYVVGNCRKQQRSLIYIALSAALSSLIAILLFDLSLCRTVFFTSISATFVGNRSTQLRNIQKFSPATYFVLSVIHSFIIIIIVIGSMRVVLDRRISVVTENSYARVSASLGSVIQDKYFRIPSKDIFENFSRMEYLPSQHITILKTRATSTERLNGQEELSVFDYLTVLITDFMRYSTKLSKNTKRQGSSALRLAVWRTFALHVPGSSPNVLDVTPYASDERVLQECSKYLKNKVVGETAKDSSCWQHRVIKKACRLLHVIIE
uniref:TM2 domain-containing protein n=1 Tax=Elaeophora elaphi TaxID=1147741 RepID=A0A0R3RV43_9BILA